MDARLLGAGLLGAGALVYSIMGGNEQAPSQPPPSNGEEGMQPGQEPISESAPAAVIDDETADMPSCSEPESSGTQEQRSEAENLEEPPPAAGLTAAPSSEEGANEEPTIIDSHTVLGMIEDVFSKPAERLLADDSAAVAGQADATPGGAAEPQKPTLQPSGEEEARTPQSATAAKATERPAHHAPAGALDMRAAQLAISTGMAESAGESVASDVNKVVASKPPAVAPAPEPHAPVPPAPPKQISEGIATAAAKLTGVALEDLKTLGLQADLTAAGLIAEASRRGAGPGDNWDQYAARHRQAEADAAALHDLLASAAEHVRKELAAADAAVGRSKHEAEVARRAAAAQVEHFRSVLGDALKAAEEAHAQRMKVQAEQFAVAHAEMTVRERAERQAKVDQLRLRLGGLEAALEQRSKVAKDSHEAHRLAQGAFALRAALSAGTKADDAAAYFDNACKGDPLVAAAVRAVPRGQPLRTLGQLQAEFSSVERAAKELAPLPAGQGGMLSAAVAKLAAKLKVAEHEPLASALPPSTSIDAAMAAVRKEVSAGRLLAAAQRLQHVVAGTAAERAVADWVGQAKARAAAEQAATLVEAHAAAATASLA